MKKRNILITYAGKNQLLISCVEKLSVLFKKSTHKINIQAASDIGISDIISSDVVLFGAGSSNEYREIEYMIEDINLDGKKAGFFTVSNTGINRKIKDHLKNTGIDVITPDLEYCKEGIEVDIRSISSWVENFH